MIEYPKAVYKGSTANYTAKVVNDSDEEFTAKSDGFIEFCYLAEPKTKSKKSNTVEAVDDGNNELRDTAISDSELAAS